MVIQRWQSVLLLIATIMMGCFTFLSLGQIQATDFTYNYTTLGFSYEGIPTDGAPQGFAAHTWILFILSLMSVILPCVAIFMYKNMRAQIRVCYIELLFIMAVAAIAAKNGYDFSGEFTMGWSSVIITVPIALVAVIAALRCIISDRRKLLSVDRLR